MARRLVVAGSIMHRGSDYWGGRTEVVVETEHDDRKVGMRLLVDSHHPRFAREYALRRVFQSIAHTTGQDRR